MTALLSESPSIVAALDYELAYLDALPRRMEPDTIAGQFMSVHALLVQASAAWYGTADSTEALDIIRKIAGTALRALIIHGCPERQVPLTAAELILIIRDRLGTAEEQEKTTADLKDYREQRALDDALQAMQIAGLTVDRGALSKLVGIKTKEIK